MGRPYQGASLRPDDGTPYESRPPCSFLERLRKTDQQFGEYPAHSWSASLSVSVELLLLVHMCTTQQVVVLVCVRATPWYTTEIAGSTALYHHNTRSHGNSCQLSYPAHLTASARCWAAASMQRNKGQRTPSIFSPYIPC